MNIYISQKAADWLLEENNPVIRYLSLRDLELPGRRSCEADYLAAENFLFTGKNLAYFTRYDKSNFDLRRKGSLWKFAYLAECGISANNEHAAALLSDILNHSYIEPGAFSFNTNPRAVSGILTGEMLKFMTYTGYRGKELHDTAAWVSANQRFDGGWLHSPFYDSVDVMRFILLNRPGNKRKEASRQNAPSCLYATAACLEGLIEYSNLFGTYQEQIARGLAFLDTHSVFRGKIKVSSADGIFYNNNVSEPGYPLIAQIDIIRLLLIIKKARSLTDSRYGKHVNSIITCMNREGMWKFSSHAKGMMNTGYAKTGTDKWVTLNALRLLKESV